MIRQRSCTTPPSDHRGQRAGFTLIELLIVVSILLIPAAVSASVIRIATEGDRVRGTARQVQSYLQGARDRAIFFKRPIGVRFETDPNEVRLVTSMVYVELPKQWTLGSVQFERLDLNSGMGTAFAPDGTADGVNLIVLSEKRSASNAYSTGWKQLYDRKLIDDNTHVTVGGLTYTVDLPRTTLLMDHAGETVLGNPYLPKLVLTTPTPTSAPNLDATVVNPFEQQAPLSYALQLPALPLPGEQPRAFPTNAVIHLDRCSSNPDAGNGQLRGNKLPSAWLTFPNGTSQPPIYTRPLDIMFSPRGEVYGEAASAGLVHLYFGDRKDALQDQIDWAAPTASAPEYDARPSDGYTRGQKFYVSVYTRTGAVSVHQLNPSPTASLGPFALAETGETAQ